MSQHDDLPRLRDMLAHAEEAAALVRERCREDLDSQRVLALALVRLLEIIGEAAARVSSEFRARHPEIPWPQIVSLRNRLIHGYDAVDLDIVWQILTTDLPSLIEVLRAIPNLRGDE